MATYFDNNTFQVSGNVFVVSGNSWIGVGSVYNAGGFVSTSGNDIILGSVAITNTVNTLGSVAITNQVTVQPLIGSIFGIGAGSVYARVLGSVAVTSQAVWPGAGSIYGIGIGSVYAQTLGSVTVTNPSTVGSLAIQGVLGSVAVTNQSKDFFLVSGNSWTGVGSVLVTNGSVNVYGTMSASVEAAFIPSGNIFLVSGNSWAGVGSVYTVNSAGASTSSTITAGNKTVTTAGTSETLAGSTACTKVIIQAFTSNTDYVAVGGSPLFPNVTGTGIVLGAGDSTEIEIANLESVWVDAKVSSEGMRFVYFV